MNCYCYCTSVYWIYILVGTVTLDSVGSTLACDTCTQSTDNTTRTLITVMSPPLHATREERRGRPLKGRARGCTRARCDSPREPRPRPRPLAPWPLAHGCAMPTELLDRTTLRSGHQPRLELDESIRNQCCKPVPVLTKLWPRIILVVEFLN